MSLSASHSVSAASGTSSADGAVRVWLFAVAALVFAMIVVGGAVRLTDSGLSAIAVLDDDGRVAGLFGEDELLRGLFPGYLAELHHTSFTQDDLESLVSRLAEIGSAPVAGYLRAPLVVELETSATHIAELLLHSEVTVVAVVRKGVFAGMLSEAAFCRALLRRLRG